MEAFESQQSKGQHIFTHELSVKDWVLTLLLTALPVIGLVMLLIYAFGNDQNPNRKNWAKAQLILIAIAFVIMTILVILFWAVFAASWTQDT